MAQPIKNAPSTRVDNKKTIQGYIDRMQGEIKKALPSVLTPERFTRMVLSALSRNPALGNCTPQSFMAAMMTAAQLGVEPNTPLGQAYLIPYNNHGKMEVQFQLGYKGLIDLAYRSGEVEIIQAHVVYENDEFDFEYGLDAGLKHKPAQGDRGEPVYVYGVFKTKDGGYGFEVMSMEDVRKHAAKYSPSVRANRSSPWQTNFEEMAKKTTLIKALKYAPLKTDFVRAANSDETIKTDIAADMLDVPDETIFEAEYEEVTDEPANGGADAVLDVEAG
ncbi:MAG: recombinase RecT [Oscillospiraceae bacterium]|nr:recombinase RecT [Oscillospiraceae bacterium]